MNDLMIGLAMLASGFALGVLGQVVINRLTLGSWL